MKIQIQLGVDVNFRHLTNLKIRFKNLFRREDDKIDLIPVPYVPHAKFAWLPIHMINGTTSWLELVDREMIAGGKWTKVATERMVDYEKEDYENLMKSFFSHEEGNND